MKKYSVMVMMALAIGFASCDSKKAEVQEDPTSALVEELKNQVENQDTAAVKASLEAVQAEIAELAAENPDAAKDYINKVQTYLKENTEKINALIGENEKAEYIVNTLVNAPAETVVDVITAGQSVVDNAEATADEAAKTAEEALQNKANEVVNEANKKAEEQKAEANKKVNEAKQKANEEVNKAAQKANQEVNKAAEKLLKEAGLK